MAKKMVKGLGGLALLFGGAFAFLLFTRKSKALPVPGDTAPPPPETSGGTETEVAPEQPIAPAIEGRDRWPRYTTAMVSTSKGPVLFEKEFDPDAGSVRWIPFKDSKYGTYRDIGTLSINHPPIRLYTATGAVLWEGGQFTYAGQQFFGLPAGAPLSTTVVS